MLLHRLLERPFQSFLTIALSYLRYRARPGPWENLGIAAVPRLHTSPFTLRPRL